MGSGAGAGLLRLTTRMAEPLDAGKALGAAGKAGGNDGSSPPRAPRASGDNAGISGGSWTLLAPTTLVALGARTFAWAGGGKACTWEGS
mmetsp:Transcript_106017/g.188564  ORF Transcript_106017/g.188564 Transcript_106017/m.188564 type:complete len:89 (-) Transcript_106017:3652-3918(-)